MIFGCRREREDEVAGGADLRRQSREARHVGLEVLEGLGPAHADQQPCTDRADDTQRHARVETLRGERQRIEHRETLAVVELAPERWGVAPDRDAAVFVAATNFHIDDAGLGLLALPAWRFVPT
jgi:hypothetical protein